MSLRDFLRKQFVDVIHWTEADDGVLSYRYPMQDMEIQYGAQLTVRESQMALFVNEGKVADAFGPGLHKLETRTLPLLTNLQHWDKAFQSPFKSDVYFFSTRLQTNQRWGTQQPITIRDKDFGMVRLRGFGIYAYQLENPLLFHQRVSGTREVYTVGDLEGHLRNSIIGRVSDAFAESGIPFIDMAANLHELSERMRELLAPTFAELGLKLQAFVVENLSLPEELQKLLDQRIGMNMVGDMRQYAQFQAAQSMPIAAANEGGGAGLGAGLGAGMAMGKMMTDALAGGQSAGGQPAGSQPAGAPAAETKFCSSCGAKIARASKFCSECGTAQS
ncbi:MAG TPA: SPFH domain-containing protein [Gemmatimonadaceae bacterium]|nr:SPFH domain-containing protein [Gemmatimonadaceae bacterium]